MLGHVFRAVLAIVGLTIFLLLDRTTAVYALVVSIFVTSAIFCASYVVWSNWRATPAGRALLYCALAVALITGQSTLTVLLGPEYPGRRLVQVILFYSLLFGIVDMIRALWKTQWADRLERAKRRTDRQSDRKCTREQLELEFDTQNE